MTLTTLDNLEWLLGPEDTMEDTRTWRMEDTVFWNTASRDRGFSLLHSGTLFKLNGTRIDTWNNQHLKCSHFEKLHFALYNYTIEKCHKYSLCWGPWPMLLHSSIMTIMHMAMTKYNSNHKWWNQRWQPNLQVWQCNWKMYFSWATKCPKSQIPDKQ